MAAQRTYTTTTTERGRGRGPGGGGGVITLLLIGVGGYFVYEKVLKPGVLKKVQIANYARTLKVNVPGIKLKGDTVEVDMFIQNPNPTPLMINAVVADVTIITKEGAAYKIGNLDRYGTVTVKPMNQTQYTFPIKLKALNMVALLTQMFSGKVSGLTAKIDGAITIDKSVIPIHETVRIS
jgi:hypothetical protein